MFDQRFGILSGLLAAFCQSLSYLASRHFVQRRPAAVGDISASRQLLVLSHLWMGLFACIVLPFIWPASPIPWSSAWLPLAINVLLYCSGQMGLAMALQHAEASRVSPLMTSKLILSAILVMLYGQPVGGASRWLTPLQWAGVAMCIVAGISINFTGGRMKTAAIIGIIWSAGSFSLSDWFINRSIAAFTTPEISAYRASLLTGVFGYILTGLIALPLLRRLGSRNPRTWIDSAPFAVTWFGAMFGLFTAFALVGIMLGSILQCTRGFITILLGAALMRMGQHHIEPPAPRSVMLRRLAAGLLMFAGITLYLLKDGGNMYTLFHPAAAVALPQKPAP